MKNFSIKEFIASKFVSDSIMTIGSHVFVGISGLIINSLVGIQFTASGLGIFSQGLSIYLLLSLFANFGIQISSQKHASQYSEIGSSLKLIFVSAVVATIAISIFITTLFYIFLVQNPALFKSNDILEFTQLICIAVPFFAVNKTMNSFMIGLRKMNIYAGVRSIRWLIIVSGILILSLLNYPLNAIPHLFFLTEICLFIFLIFVCQPYWGGINAAFIKTHLSFGIKNIMAGFVGEFITRTPILIIGYFSGNAAAGYFAYVLTFARSILMIPAAIQKSFNPVFTKLWYQNDINSIKSNIAKVFKVCFYTLIPVFLVLYAFFLVYTHFVMPNEYLELHWILIVLLVGMSTTYVYGPFSTFLMMTDHLYSNLLRVSIFAGFNLFLILYLILDYGNVGVACAITVSMIFNLFVLDIFYRRILKIHLFKITLFNQFNG